MRPHHSELRPVQEILKKFLTTGKIAQKLRWAAVMKAWEEAAGPAIREQAFPQALTRGLLIVGVTSSSWQQELLFEKTRILEGLRERLKKEQIRDIRFKISTASAKVRTKRPGKQGARKE